MSEDKEWRHYDANDSPLIGTIIKEMAASEGLSAELWERNVRVYCTRAQWVDLLVRVANRIYCHAR